MTPRRSLPSIPRLALFAVLAFVFGVGGVLAGYFVRRSLSRPPQMTAIAPHSLLDEAMAFPDVPILAENDRGTSTRELRGDDGCVFLFLDLACPPCGEMAQKWQEVLASGEPSDLRVFGITNHPVAAIEGFKVEYGVSFPILQDAGKVFLNTYEVNRFPLEVVVGSSGTIRLAPYEAEVPLDPVRLHRLLADTPG